MPTFTRRTIPSGRVGGVQIPSDIADTGQGIEARGLSILGRSITDIGNLLFELSERERKADDLLASDNAGIARQSAADNYIVFKGKNKDPKLWSEAAKRFRDDADTAFEKLEFFDLQRKERETIRHKAEMNHFEAIAQLQITDAKSKIAVEATTDSFVTAFANNSSDLVAKETDLDEALLNEFGSELAAVEKEEILSLAEKQRIALLLNQGNFEAAEKLASKATGLTEVERKAQLNEIRVSKNIAKMQVKEARDQLIKDITSQTINEFFKGELEIDELFRRHSIGLVSDSEFKFMIKSLTETTPEHSDLIAAGRIRRAKVDFDMGVIDRAGANKIVLKNYTRLDGESREKVFADLEDIEAKIIATAKSNAYSEGISLMSRRFVGIQTEEDLIDIFKGAGLSEDEKKRINRRWTAEVNNRDLYERAVEDRFKEMRKDGISDSSKYTSESLKILLQYQRRGRLSLVGLETKIREEQREITGEPPEFIGPPSPLKSIDEMTTAEKQKELERIRELRRLAK